MNEKISSILRFICLSYLAVFVPQCISWFNARGSRNTHRLGIEVLLATPKKYIFLKKVRLAFIGNDDVALKEGGFDIQASLLLSRSNRVEAFLHRYCREVDVVLLDCIPDGFYSSFLHTLLKSVLKFCAQHKKGVVILDRPNPLGAVIEGGGAIPWRYGVTIGELAWYYNKHIMKKRARLRVIKMERWRRSEGLVQQVDFLSPVSAIDPLAFFATDAGGLRINSLSQWEVRYLKRLCWGLGLQCFERTGDRGVGLHFSLKRDVTRFSAFNSFLTVIRFLNNRKTITLSFKKRLDKLFHTADVRKFFQKQLSFEQLKNNTEASLDEFYDKVRRCCLYKPLPVVIVPEIPSAELG